MQQEGGVVGGVSWKLQQVLGRGFMEEIVANSSAGEGENVPVKIVKALYTNK